jgi:hypothetical protein
MTPMSAVMDANIVNGISAESCGSSHQLSDSPCAVEALVVSSGIPVCMDEGGRIEAEWRRCCDPDWIDNWYVTFSSNANVISISVPLQRMLLRKLQQDCGFPRSADGIVVRTSVAAAELFGDCMLVTEDLDFYEPAEKQSGNVRRSRYMRGQREGSVKSHLQKKQHVSVMSVALAIPLL